MTTTTIDRSRARLWIGIARVADPKITLASMASIFLGAAAAARDGPMAWGWLALTVVGIFFVEAAKNASGDVFDFDSGADQAVAPEDRSPFSGGKRVLLDGLMSRSQLAAVAAAFYALGGVAGLAIVIWRDATVAWLGAIGALIAFFYHAPPLKLAYRGFGELAVAVTYGPLICGGTYLVQRGALPPQIIALAAPLGLLIGGFLWINEFPDHHADAQAHKRTLVVRLGRRRASRAFALLVSLAFSAQLALPLAGITSWSWLGLAGAPLAIAAARRLWREYEQTSRMVAAQRWTLLSFVALAFGGGIGLLVGG